MEHAFQPPLVSVVILNYNGARWLERCLASLRGQTIFPQIEIILADNASTDGSNRSAEERLSSWPNAKFVQHRENLGYCEGNNRAAQQARGEFLLFLNNDTWLEPDCLEILIREVRLAGAAAATPLILNYDDSTFQSLGAQGFDAFGFTSTRSPFGQTREVFMPEGCAYMVKREVFEPLGQFDPELFMYSDELDLSWRLWLAGFRAIGVPAAKLHHRGAANVEGHLGALDSEIRTTETKRFYANRNGLLVVLKNAQGLLLAMLPLQLALLAVEALAGVVLVRRWSFVRKSYVAAVADCWRLRHHVRAQRARIAQLRMRSDFWMLRFLRLRFNRWDELRRIARHGRPKVSSE